MGLVTGPHARDPPHPQPVCSGPQQPAQRADSRGWESARLRTPHTQAGGPPPRAPSCRPHSAQRQLARARAVGLVTGPHARTSPHPQPVGSGPRQPAQRAGIRGWESARPRTPHTQAGGAPPPPGTLMLPPQHARARAVGLVTGPHARTPPHLQPVGSGPRQPAQRAGSRGGRAPDPGRPTPRQEAPPRGALVPPPQRARPARKSACCGVGDRSPRPHPPAPTASGYWAPAARQEGRQSGMGERPTPDAPHPGKRRPPPGTLMPPPQHARARAVGLVTGPHARTPPHLQPVGSGPRQPAQRAGSRGWESAQPRTPHTQAGSALPGRPRAGPTARKASSQERALRSW